MPCPSLYETTDRQRRRQAYHELNIHWIRWRFLFTGAELVVIDAMIRVCHGQVTLHGRWRALHSVELQIVASAIASISSPQ